MLLLDFPKIYTNIRVFTHISFGGLTNNGIKNCRFKKWNGFTYARIYSLYKLTLPVVYREISQQCFDPAARIPDGPRGMPVSRARRNTCSTQVHACATYTARYTVPVGPVGDAHRAHTCATNLCEDVLCYIYEVTVIELAIVGDNFLAVKSTYRGERFPSCGLD